MLQMPLFVKNRNMDNCDVCYWEEEKNPSLRWLALPQGKYKENWRSSWLMGKTMNNYCTLTAQEQQDFPNAEQDGQ